MAQLSHSRALNEDQHPFPSARGEVRRSVVQLARWIVNEQIIGRIRTEYFNPGLESAFEAAAAIDGADTGIERVFVAY